MNSAKPSVISYDDALLRIEKEYNSVVRQTRVQVHLNGIRIGKFMIDETDVATALENIYKRILAMSRQDPESHQGDGQNAGFLRIAVVGHLWASKPLERNDSSGLPFQKPHSEL